VSLRERGSLSGPHFFVLYEVEMGQGENSCVRSLYRSSGTLVGSRIELLRLGCGTFLLVIRVWILSLAKEQNFCNHIFCALKAPIIVAEYKGRLLKSESLIWVIVSVANSSQGLKFSRGRYSFSCPIPQTLHYQYRRCILYNNPSDLQPK
jgi:hypothetical protein